MSCLIGSPRRHPHPLRIGRVLGQRAPAWSSVTAGRQAEEGSSRNGSMVSSVAQLGALVDLQPLILETLKEATSCPGSQLYGPVRADVLTCQHP
jgi:hypothetical protein